MEPSTETRVTRELLVEEAKNNVRVGLLTGLLGGVILGFLFASATLALNPELLESERDVLVLLLGLQIVYSVFCLALGLLGAAGKTLIFSFSGRRLSDTKTAAFITGVVFFLITGFYGFAWCRWHRIGGLSPESLPGLADLPILLTIAAVALLLSRLLTYAFYLLIVHFKKPERRQPGDLRKAFFILLYMGGAFVLFIVFLRVANPIQSDAQGLSREDVHSPRGPVLLLAVDGLTQEDLEWLDREGLLPWRETRHEGVRASVETLPRAIAPVVWTAVATGQDLDAHGIVDYRSHLVRGLSRPFTIGPEQIGLFHVFQNVMPWFRLSKPIPMRSYMRGVKSLWNITTEAGLEAAVINWWVSWPAERIKGRIVSDHAFLRLSTGGETPSASERETYPATLLAELAPYAAPPDSDRDAVSGSGAGERRDGIEDALAVHETLGLPDEVIRSDLFYAKAARHLLADEVPDLWMLHLPGPDIVRRLLTRSGAGTEALEQALRAYWRVLTPVLEECRLRAPTEGIELWLSLPGFPFPGRPGDQGTFALRAAGREADAPATPARAARDMPAPAPALEDARISISDVTPTILWLLGLPAARDMGGLPRPELAGAASDSLFPVRWIDGYGRLRMQEPTHVEGSLDEEMLERFRSLGYIEG